MNSSEVPNSARSAGDQVEHLRLDGRVERRSSARRGSAATARRERHRDHDPLLHPAGELVRIAAHDRCPGRRSAPSASISSRALERSGPRIAGDLEDLRHLPADLDRGVQRAAGLLVDHRDAVRAQLAQLAGRSGPARRGRRSAMSPLADPPVAGQVAHDGQRHRRLAAAGLADEPVGLAACDVNETSRSTAARARGRGRTTSRCSTRAARRPDSGPLTIEHPSIASAIRLTAITSEAIASASNSDLPPVAGRHLAVVGRDLEPPVGRRRLDAEAEEGQRRDREDRVAEADRGLDEDRRHHVRQDLDEHDVRRPLAAQPRGGDVVELALDQDRGAHRARDQRREQDPDDDDQRSRSSARARLIAISAVTTSGQRQERLDEAADDVVGEAAEVARHQPERGAEHGARAGSRAGR